ncbi:hypothetical protein CcI6DRAFT_03576 [Frankia sp. CcI6]|nr:hypothetical protein CcI6DRAFT_03576 [Frankia sp. CcI6]KFB03472.1 hypothetical protein ALLO2DRAFT_03808 [Frankia sp. Allo2]
MLPSPGRSVCRPHLDLVPVLTDDSGAMGDAAQSVSARTRHPSRRAVSIMVTAILLILFSALPAGAMIRRPTYHPLPVINVSYETGAVSGVGRQTDLTITDKGPGILHVQSISVDGERLLDQNSHLRIAPGHSYMFTFGWAGGPGGGPDGPTVVIDSDAPTSPTVLHIGYQ